MLGRASPYLVDSRKYSRKPKKLIPSKHSQFQDSNKVKRFSSTRSKSISESKSPANEFLRWSQNRPRKVSNLGETSEYYSSSSFAERLRKSL